MDIFRDDDDSEIAAIAAIGAVLSKVTDPEARSRVLTYILSRYLPEGSARPALPAATWNASAGAPASAVAASPLHVVEQTQRELPGVARVEHQGDAGQPHRTCC